MEPNKYLGVDGLQALMVLAQGDIAKKSDKMQFLEMPNAAQYAGKVVQYVGPTDTIFTRSHFYYSNGTRWSEEDPSSSEQNTQLEIVTSLPTWAEANPGIIYVLKDTATSTMGLFLKDTAHLNVFYTVESGGNFVVVATLPQWSDAKLNTIYFKADGNVLTGYIKKAGTIGAWYTVGGGAEIVVDTVLSPSSTNPVQNKVVYAAIQDVLAQVSSIYHFQGSCTAAELPGNADEGDVWNLTDASEYGPVGTNVAWDGAEWDALGGNIAIDPVPTNGSANAVASGGVFTALEAKEDVANKVTSIDASSTDDQYPSAKCMYDALENLEPIPPGFIQNVDTSLQPVEDGKAMRISKTAFDALPSRDADTMYYVPEEHDLLDAKPTCYDANGDQVKNQKIVELTKAQYDALVTKDPDTYYVITDDSDAGILTRRPAWSQATAIAAGDLLAGYTAPSDGLFVLAYAQTATQGTNTIVSVNNVPVAQSYFVSTTDVRAAMCNTPVSAGDIIKISASMNSVVCNFVPYEDSAVSDVQVVTPELIRNMHDPDWSQIVNITAAQLSAGYTAQQRGIVCITGRHSTSTASWITVNNIKVGYCFGGNSTIVDCQVNTPVNNGDIIKSSSLLSVDFSATFIPYKAQ